MLSDELLRPIYVEAFNKAMHDKNSVADAGLTGLRAVAEAAVKDAVGGDEPVGYLPNFHFLQLRGDFGPYRDAIRVYRPQAKYEKDRPEGSVALYTRPQASAAVPDDVAKDAERYRWLKSRMVGVNFDWDDEGMTALAFEMPDNLSFCADCDKNIDSAMLAASQPEVRNAE